MFKRSFKVVLSHLIVFLLCINIVSARWLSVDPKADQYPSISP